MGIKWIEPTLAEYRSAAASTITGGSRRLMRNSEDPRPIISIITVVRNAKNELGKTIASILEQDYDRIEFIVIDGASSDGTVDTLRNLDQHIHFWSSARDRGIADAMNIGVARATGDIVNFLNAGDYYTDSAVLSFVADWYQKERWTWAFGLAKLMVDFKETGFKQRYRPYRKWHSFYYTPMCHQATFYRINLFNEIGLHKVGNDRLFDIDFVLRASNHSLPAGTPRYFVWYDVTGYSSNLRLRSAIDRIQVVAAAGRPRFMALWALLICYRQLRSYGARLFKAAYRNWRNPRTA